jgi:hypothetical protein
LIHLDLDGEEHVYETRILWLGLQHKIEVNMDGILVFFEPDEERNYRAVLPAGQIALHQSIPRSLLKAIALYLESVLKS